MAEKKKKKRNWEEINGRKGKRYVPRAEGKGQRPARPVKAVKADAYEVYEEQTSENVIIGRNPVIEALKNDREIEKILIGKGAEGSIAKIIGMAKDKQIPIYQSDKITLDRIAAGGSHQGVIAYASAYRYAEIEDIYALAEKRGEDPFIIILDNLEDPHNLGAIMRTAECAGAHGVIIPKRRACGLTEAAVKASAGAVEYVPCVKVANIGQTIDRLKENGIWIAACDMGGVNYYNQDLTGKIALVIGSEGTGISQLVRKKCDYIVSMPMVGKITSLNASNAAAILMYEVRKQRDGK
ncbi:Putative TrmH family tRNA/rRNA methyltransferase [uncultured Eubacterium sp.]|nr:Putative TrmH family tRNA/rRNA methyltransferase [uncultured Eubacterium sp.]